MSKTAIIEAVRYLDLADTRRLLAKRPDLLGVTDATGRTLLHLACCANAKKLFKPAAAQLKLARFLLDAGLGDDIDRPVGKDKCTALFFAVARARNTALIKLLMQRGAKVRAAPGGGLFAAAWYDDVHHLRLLLDAGAELDVVAGVTPFMAAWSWRQFKSARLLAERGADVDFQDRKGRTALRYGVDKEYDPRELSWLVRHGASPDIRASDGISARVRASRKRDKRWSRAMDQRGSRSA